MRLFLFCLSLFCSSCLWAQQDSLSIGLPSVDVLGQRVQSANDWHKSWRAKGAEQVPVGNLSDVLTSESALFIRSYGLGSLATPSVRGTGSSHLAVLWQGFNIQSIMNGNLDLALLPAQGFNNIQLQYGGGTALFGSGALGGVLHLDNQLPYDQGLEVGFSARLGAFRQMDYETLLTYSSRKISTRWQLFYRSARNDFSFRNTTVFAAPEQLNDNAALNQKGLTQESRITLAKNQFINFATWLQYSDREIPASMTEAASQSYQLDGSIRQSIGWEGSSADYRYGIRLAYQREDIRFVDPEISLNAFSRAHSCFVAIDQAVDLSEKWSFDGGWQSEWHFASADNYPIDASLSRHAAFARLMYGSRGLPWKAQLSVRQGFDALGLFPLSAEGAFWWDVHPDFQLFGNVSRNFRNPTFNDLFWIGAGAEGNPDLLSENGWSLEKGLVWSTKKRHTRYTTEFTAFSILTQNWIIWLPNLEGGQQIWRPTNEQQVWSRGFEIDQQLEYLTKVNTIRLNFNYHLSKATNQKGEHEGKILIYTPVHQAGLGLNWTYLGKWSLGYQHNLVGQRFTNRNNSQALPAYTLGNIDISHKGNYKNVQIIHQFRINNLWSQDYQVIAFRPQAPRWVEWRLNLTFKQNKKHMLFILF
ncbi:MAG: TonB-dependent receptor, partial [Bacteroidota bacterium]